MRYRHKISIVLLLLMLGCSKNKGEDNTVTSISITPQATVAIGTPLQMSARGQTAFGADAVSVAVTWQSSDPSIATVDGNGRLSGVAVGVATLSAKSGDLSATATIGVVSAAMGKPSLAISGKAFYEDKPYTKDGFTGTTKNEPIRRAVMNLIAIDGFATIAATSTGEDGSYSFSGIDNSSRRGGVYLQIMAKTSDDRIAIFDNPSSKGLLAISKSAFNDAEESSFTSDLVVHVSEIGGAFNILDAILKGNDFVKNMAALLLCPATHPQCIPPPLTLFWSPGNGTGTFFDSGLKALFINGTATDEDEYDDTVILHEYGHFTANSFAHDNSPGGVHFIGVHTEDIRLSWSEGWATFFASAVLNSPIAVDTSAKGVFTFNIDNNSSIYTTDELANSSALWDTFTATSTTTGFSPIWKSLIGISPTDTATIESFAVLFMNQNPAAKNSFQDVLKGRSIELFPDPFEGAEVTLIVGSTQHHTLYTTDNMNPFGDEDIIPMNVNANQQYTLKTFNLTNGADTFLTIDLGSGLTNDNANGLTYAPDCETCPKNDTTTLSSSISFTPSTGGTFSVHVKRSPNAPNSTGRAGSYDIQLTSP